MKMNNIADYDNLYEIKKIFTNSFSGYNKCTSFIKIHCKRAYKCYTIKMTLSTNRGDIRYYFEYVKGELHRIVIIINEDRFDFVNGKLNFNSEQLLINSYYLDELTDDYLFNLSMEHNINISTTKFVIQEIKYIHEELKHTNWSLLHAAG